MTDTLVIRSSVADGFLTDAERQRLAVLVRNAEIRSRFRALRAARRTVSAALVSLSQDARFGLSTDGVRRVIYPVASGEPRPWLEPLAPTSPTDTDS